MICRYKIKEIGNFFGGLTGKSKEDFDNGNARYVSYMTVFSNYQLPNVISDTVTISENEKQNRIKKGDILFTGSSETPDESKPDKSEPDDSSEPPAEDIDGYLVTYKSGNSWDNSGVIMYGLEIQITNGSDSAVSGWTLELEIEDLDSVDGWNGTI